MGLLHIAVLAGTTRPKRESINPAKLIASIGRSIEGIEIIFVDPMDYRFAGDGNDEEGKDPKYTEITKKADAFFIVTPEYNHSFPGSLKRMLDSELSNYIHKPVAFAGVSSGRWGGIRAIEALNQAVREMGMVSTFTDVQFPNVSKLFGPKGELLEPVYYDLVKNAYAELIWMAKTLQWGRDNLK
jgi:NAD(P)H-dependent FMN reductase